jgi:hypothetical protein
MSKVCKCLFCEGGRAAASSAKRREQEESPSLEGGGVHQQHLQGGGSRSPPPPTQHTQHTRRHTRHTHPHAVLQQSATPSTPKRRARSDNNNKQHLWLVDLALSSRPRQATPPPKAPCARDAQLFTKPTRSSARAAAALGQSPLPLSGEERRRGVPSALSLPRASSRCTTNHHAPWASCTWTSGSRRSGGASFCRRTSSRRSANT